jgi:hypothetical protein
MTSSISAEPMKSVREERGGIIGEGNLCASMVAAAVESTVSAVDAAVVSRTCIASPVM